jgi:uncharacterized membrane protein YozB (DUF420 family)
MGSIAMIFGLIGFATVSTFLVSLTAFSLRTHGPMGEMRYQELVSNFPWWAPLLAICGIVLGIWMLKKYDFSYKKNFFLIIAAFITSIILAAGMAEYLGLNDTWSRQGPMKRFYQQTGNQNSIMPRGQNQGPTFKLK